MIGLAMAAERVKRMMDQIERDRLVREDIEDLLGPVKEGDPR